MIRAGRQFFKMAASRIVDVSEEEIDFMKIMLFRGTNTPTSSEWHSLKVRCGNCAKCNKETIQTLYLPNRMVLKNKPNCNWLRDNGGQWDQKCFSKFYVSVRRKDGSYYKRNSLLSLRVALWSHPINYSKYFLSGRYFYNNPSYYTKTNVRRRLVKIGEYSPSPFSIPSNAYIYIPTLCLLLYLPQYLPNNQINELLCVISLKLGPTVS